MSLMQEGTKKIEAIKVHRSLTGYGLKESKDMVGKYWRGVGSLEKSMRDYLYSEYVKAEDKPIVEAFLNKLGLT